MIRLLWPFLFTPIVIRVPWPRWGDLWFWFREWRKQAPCMHCGRPVRHRVEIGSSTGVENGEFIVECAACVKARYVSIG
jgi:hypothetical protein